MPTFHKSLARSASIFIVGSGFGVVVALHFDIVAWLSSADWTSLPASVMAGVIAAVVSVVFAVVSAPRIARLAAASEITEHTELRFTLQIRLLEVASHLRSAGGVSSFDFRDPVSRIEMEGSLEEVMEVARQTGNQHIYIAARDGLQMLRAGDDAFTYGLVEGSYSTAVGWNAFVAMVSELAECMWWLSLNPGVGTLPADKAAGLDHLRRWMSHLDSPSC